MKQQTAHREFWGSKMGFVFAAMGSAVGLANIIRFPYLVGANGGAAFIAIYLICLVVLSFPIFIAELLLGRACHRNPAGAFEEIGGTKTWRYAGCFTILTGFFVSGFYAVVSGWVVGYLADAVQGSLLVIDSSVGAESFFYMHLRTPLWSLGMQLCFVLLAAVILFSGVRNGLERASKFLMPVLILLLLYMAMTGLDADNAQNGLHFLFDLQWHEVTPTACLLALGQAFFTLSLGQGTMITYGSYLNRKTNLFVIGVPVVVADTVISILGAIAVFTIVFSVGMEPDSGMALMFKTLPLAFNTMANGYFLSISFFALLALAALTSQISAMEPAIAYLMDERGWTRKRSVVAVSIGVFLLGIPCAMSYDVLNLFDFIATGILIPMGGLLVTLLLGWRWGIAKSIRQLNFGLEGVTFNQPLLELYFTLCVKYLAPLAIFAIALQVLFT